MSRISPVQMKRCPKDGGLLMMLDNQSHTMHDDGTRIMECEICTATYLMKL